MLTSECNGEQLKFSSGEGRGFSEAFRRLFLTRENAKAFQRCHFRGTKKKERKKADSSILLAFHLLFCVGLDMPGAIHTIRSPL